MFVYFACRLCKAHKLYQNIYTVIFFFFSRLSPQWNRNEKLLIFGRSKVKQIILDQNWECLETTRLCKKNWTMITLRRWINLATLNPYSIYKHLRLSYQKYYAKGNLEKCRPLYSKHGLSFLPGQGICFVELSIYTRIKAVKQRLFPSMDDSGYLPSSRKECLHFSLFNIFPSTCQMGWCGKRVKRAKLAVWRAGDSISAPPSFQLQYKERGEKNPSFNDLHASYSLSQRGRG